MERRKSRYYFSKSQKTSSEMGLKDAQNRFWGNISKEGLVFAIQIFLADIWKISKNSVMIAYQNLRDELRADSKTRLKIEGFEKIRKHRPDYLILLFMGLIMLIGVITMYSLSPQRAAFLNKSYGGNYDSMHFFWRQIMSLGLGLIAFVAMSRVPISWIYRHSGKILAIGFVICAILAVLGFAKIPPAKCELGACRWFKFGSVSVQPSEFLKVGVLIALAVFLGSKAREGKINDFRETILPSGLLVGLMLVFIAGFQKDLGTAISALAIVAFQFFMAGLNRKNVIAASLIGLVAIVGMM